VLVTLDLASGAQIGRIAFVQNEEGSLLSQKHGRLHRGGRGGREVRKNEDVTGPNTGREKWKRGGKDNCGVAEEDSF